MESCQNIGKILRKTNYSSEIYEVEPVVYIEETSQPTCDASQLHDQVNCMNSIQPNPILEIFRARTHQSLSDLRINKDDD